MIDGYEVQAPKYDWEIFHETMKEWLEDYAPGGWSFCEEWREGPNVVCHATFFIENEAVMLAFCMNFNIDRDGNRLWGRTPQDATQLDDLAKGLKLAGKSKS